MAAIHFYPLHDPKLTKSEVITHLLLWDNLVFLSMYDTPPVSCLHKDELSELKHKNLIETKKIIPEEFLKEVKEHPYFKHLPLLATEERIRGGAAFMKALNMEPYYKIDNSDEVNYAVSSTMLTWSTILSLYHHLKGQYRFS